MLARKPRIITVAACLLTAAGAHAQINEPNAARLQVQVWNGSSWVRRSSLFPA